MSKALLDGLGEPDRLSLGPASNSFGIEYFAPHKSAASTNGAPATCSFEAHARDLQKPLGAVVGKTAREWDARAEESPDPLVVPAEISPCRQRRQYFTKMHKILLRLPPAARLARSRTQINLNLADARDDLLRGAHRPPFCA